ncbi:hypothetical protein [Actinomadura rupiterrae]|uniref:hypothetical protein n=1 Tax=Actinomadura rupiterrae TaxID=559627 RepID=UPI0020A49D92|nr:hypothetical protein [Actinomadura rupiterrae]MCP2340187.1 hypothetical protein [Actinomadura rupiterrae]
MPAARPATVPATGTHRDGDPPSDSSPADPPEQDTDGQDHDAGAHRAEPLWPQVRAQGSAALAFWTPPDIWSHDRPSLERVWAYAARGAWTTPSGALRWLGRLYAVPAAVVIGLLYGLAWIVERPSRLIAALALLAVAGVWPL